MPTVDIAQLTAESIAKFQQRMVDPKAEEGTGGRDRCKAWKLLMAEGLPELCEDLLENVMINLISRETLETVIKVELGNGNVLNCEAIVDTGSPLTFLNWKEIEPFAPDLLSRVTPYRGRITGITGDQMKVKGYH